MFPEPKARVDMAAGALVACRRCDRVVRCVLAALAPGLTDD